MDWTDTWRERGASYNQAMAMFPNSRENEREILIASLAPKPGIRFLEVAPSGSAFLSLGLKKILGADFTCDAVEPSEVHSQSLPTFVRPIPKASFSDFRCDSGFYDRVANLAGLHHSPEKDLIAFFSESYRCLSYNGIIGLADVRMGGSVDKWLNEFVEHFNPHGHNGRFFSEGELSDYLERASFSNINEKTVPLRWNFSTKEDMVQFCRHLFFLVKASEEDVLRGISEILGYDDRGNTVSMRWELIYAFGTKGDIDNGQA